MGCRGYIECVRSDDYLQQFSQPDVDETVLNLSFLAVAKVK
jgi:hypothetical protein